MTRDLAIRVIIPALLTLIMALLAYFGLFTVADMVTKDAEAITVRRDGMPLDSLTYDPPAWLDGCTGARKVVDRITGDSWWVLVMGEGIYTQYVVLPVGRS